MSTSAQKVIVIGGGPVGALAALYAARRGYDTELYELRDDPNFGDPSLRPDFAVIPLALSERGIQAIAGADVPGLLDSILDNSRPIYTRMVHTEDASGENTTVPMVYGPQGECLHTLQREKITKHCLLALREQPTAKIFFNQKMSHCDLDNKVVTFEDILWKEKSRAAEQELADDVVGSKPKPVTKPAEDFDGMDTVPTNTSRTKDVKFDFLIGADGTYSSVRQSIMRSVEVDYSQEYVGAVWCDFIIPSNQEGDYPMDSKCLHVWPADEGIVMAQPDFDGTFRAGMVYEAEKVRYLEAHLEEFPEWFMKEFPGISPDLMPAEEAARQFAKHQKIPLKSIKLNKMGYKDDILLLGDSAHTMTPFHAMGMITGLEDVRVFFEKFRDPAAKALAENANGKLPPFCPEGTIDSYAAERVPDVHAMVDLAHEHFDELRYGVRDSTARARKVFDAYIARWAPSLDWTTMYARIQFGNERISEVCKKEDFQTNTVKVVGGVAMAAGGAALATGAAVAGNMIAQSV